MNKPEAIPDEALLACETCLREIPESEAISDEAAEYVVHFCGLDCYHQWQQRQARRPAQD